MRIRPKRADKGVFVPGPPDDRLLDELGAPANLPALNALIIGSAMFQIEQALRDRRVRRAVIPIYYVGEVHYDLRAISSLLHDLLVFTVVEDVQIELRPTRQKAPGQTKTPPAPVPNVCLFSGGTDSYAGILLTKELLGDVEGVFCAHVDQARIINIVLRIQETVLQPRGIGALKMLVPRIGARGYAQLRGFLYLLTAVAVAQKQQSQNILVTECGPTMYQPRFSPLDAITMTTHPFVVSKAAQIGRLLLHRDFDVITPFENLTKAEVVAISPAKEGLKQTHSCITQRFGTHDGTCYGCVIRRLAFTASGVEDVSYNNDPISDPHARAGNLYSLLTFCFEVLTSFDEMEEYETGTIRAYGKEDLFRRFALDNFAAIWRLEGAKKRVVAPIRSMLNDLRGRLGTKILDERLSHLANAGFAPDFSKKVSLPPQRKPPAAPGSREITEARESTS